MVRDCTLDAHYTEQSRPVHWGPPLIGVDRCDTNIVAIFVHLLRCLSLSILVLYLFTQNLKLIEIPSKTYCSYYIYNKN